MSATSERTFEILSDIPVPECKRRIPKFPFLEKMEVGECVLFSREEEDLYKKICSAANNFGKKKGQIFAARKTDTGYGIWRIK